MSWLAPWWFTAWRDAGRELEAIAQRTEDLETELATATTNNAELRTELGKRKAEIADAALLIPCAGSLPHRIGVLKQEFGTRVEKDGHRIEALDRNLGLANDREADARARLDRVIAELAVERARYDKLALALAAHLVELRRDGFNPAPVGQVVADEVLNHGYARTAPKPDPDAQEAERKWLKIVEAAQDRSAGSKELYNTIIADAQRWRDLQIPLEDIERRIWQGDS